MKPLITRSELELFVLLRCQHCASALFRVMARECLGLEHLSHILPLLTIQGLLISHLLFKGQTLAGMQPSDPLVPMHLDQGTDLVDCLNLLL